MASHIAEIIRFKQEINEAIDNYLTTLKENNSSDKTLGRIVDQVITYFDRIKSVYASRQSDDDDEGIVSDDKDDYNDNDNDNDNDYTRVMDGRTCFNYNNYRDPNLVNQEYELQKKLLGLSHNLNYPAFGDLDNLEEIDDSSVDPLIYHSANDNTTIGNDDTNIGNDDTNIGNDNTEKIGNDDTNIGNDNEDNNQDNNEDNNEESNSDDDPNKCIINNTKKTLKAFLSETEIELVDDNTIVDYNEPTIE
jgi:hypothetical protein